MNLSILYMFLHSNGPLIILDVIAILPYVLINRTLDTGYHFKHRIDDVIWFIPSSIYIYVFGFFFWQFWFLFQLTQQSVIEVQRFTLAWLLAIGIGYFFFIFIPTYVKVEYPKGRGISFMFLRHLHEFDKQNNACPSMHVYLVVILAIFTAHLYPKVAILSYVMAVVISLTTLTTKRHYTYDVIGGFALGIFSSVVAFLVL